MTAPASPAEPTTADDWDPSTYVSYSSLTLHRQCPQAWSYRYLRGLERDAAAAPREFGSWWHFVRAMDALDRGLRLGSLRATPKHLTTGDARLVLDRVGADPEGPVPLPTEGSLYRLPTGQTIRPSAATALAVARAYWRGLAGEDRDWWVAALGEPLPDRLAYMQARYDEEWAEDARSEVPLAVEFKFKRTVPGTSAVTPGVVDEVYLDTRRNLVVVRDAKSHGTLAPAEAADDLSDSQLHLYAWGMDEVVKAWGFPRVEALSYDRARTAMPKTPLVTKTSGTLSKSVSDYDLHTYLTTVGDGLPWGEEGAYVQTGKNAGKPKFGVYEIDEKVVEALSTPAARAKWFVRTLVPVNHNIVAAHLRAMETTQQAAVATVAEFRETGSVPRNFTRNGCRWCDYAKLCRAELFGGTDGEYPLEQYGLTLSDHS